MPETLMGLEFARLNEAASDMGWAIHPEGFARMLRCAAKYGLPIYVTENGIADKKDSLRPNYLLEHLQVLARCLERGLDIRAYYHWSLLDNFEWIHGFGPRFGLYRVDYSSLERFATNSSRLYRDIITAHTGGRPSSSLLAEYQMGEKI